MAKPEDHPIALPVNVIGSPKRQQPWQRSPGGNSRAGSSSRRRCHLGGSSIQSIIVTAILTAVPAFWLGLQVNIHKSSIADVIKDGCCACKDHSRNEFAQDSDNRNDLTTIPNIATLQCESLLQQCQRQQDTLLESIKESNDNKKQQQIPPKTEPWSSTTKNERPQLFNQNQIGGMVAGMAVTSKAKFSEWIDLGVPLDPIVSGSSHVLMLYSSESAITTQVKKKLKDDGPHMIPDVSIDEALGSCSTLHVWSLDQGNPNKTCWALVPQFGSYHVQTWRRMNPRNVGSARQTLNDQEPLRLAPRNMNDQGLEVYSIPQSQKTNIANDLYMRYFSSLEQVDRDLKDLIHNSVKPFQNSTIVVMVCNEGQADLLLNFACTATSRGLDLSSILVFATDEATLKLCQSLGLAAFHDSNVRTTLMFNLTS